MKALKEKLAHAILTKLLGMPSHAVPSPECDEAGANAPSFSPEQVAWAKKTVQDIPEVCDVLETAVKDSQLLGNAICAWPCGATGRINRS